MGRGRVAWREDSTVGVRRRPPWPFPAPLPPLACAPGTRGGWGQGRRPWVLGARRCRRIWGRDPAARTSARAGLPPRTGHALSAPAGPRGSGGRTGAGSSVRAEA